MAALKPITLYAHSSGPNPWKVAILLEELQIPYETTFLEFNTDPQNGVKGEAFLKINPNGRVPAIVDPNNDNLAVWESAAILQYLQKKYDKNNKLTPKNDKEEVEILEWLAFQISGLGPSQGQSNWFRHYHSEQLPSAKERYLNETKRCYGVFESGLKKTGTGYIVGDKLSIADIAFYPWIRIADYAGLPLETDVKENFPHVYKWWQSLKDRPSVVKAYEQQKK